LKRSSLEDMPLGEELHWRGIQTSTQRTVQHGFDLEARDFIEGKREKPAYALRDTHAKGHGCVKAEYVPTPLPTSAPATLRQGIFAAKGPYKAWIRYSNAGGSIGADKAPDPRGMAVKVFIGNDLGARLTDAPEARTQDFTGVNFPTFFVRDAAQDDVLLHSVMDSVLSQSSSAAITRFGHLFGLAAFVIKRTGTPEGKLALKATKAPAVFNPLQIQYWSQTPYLLGADAQGAPQAMKYSFRPCVESPRDAKGAQDTHRKNENGFRAAMKEQLSSSGACFDFLVQLRPGKPGDIEDTREEWKTPFYKTAEIRIPAQHFLSTEQKDFCDNLAFNPLNSLAAHQPLGWANRVRVAVYGVISRLRHGLNNQAIVEPTGAEDFSRLADEPSDSEWQ
jgi:hypothetical protein